MRNPLRWLACNLTHRRQELLEDLPKLDEKAKEIDARLHPVAGYTHALEIEAYGEIRPMGERPRRPRQPQDDE